MNPIDGGNANLNQTDPKFMDSEGGYGEHLGINNDPVAGLTPEDHESWEREKLAQKDREAMRQLELPVAVE